MCPEAHGLVYGEEKGVRRRYILNLVADSSRVCMLYDPVAVYTGEYTLYSENWFHYGIVHEQVVKEAKLGDRYGPLGMAGQSAPMTSVRMRA